MLKNKIEPRTLLSNLWIFVLFNMFLRDLHEFPTDGYIEKMMTLKLSEEIMLLYAFLGEVPILMVLFSKILNNRVNKWANTIAVIISGLGISYTLLDGHLDELFFAVVNATAFVIILLTVWRLPVDESFQKLSDGKIEVISC